jgi:Family of unknown function (DUF6510)
MSTQAPLDGNVAAGPLRTFFSVDLTVAIGQCDGCGNTAPLATSVAYVQAPGLVVRCPGCEAVLLRVVESPDRSWLDMRGLRSVSIST